MSYTSFNRLSSPAVIRSAVVEGTGCQSEGRDAERVAPSSRQEPWSFSSCSFVGVILPPLKEPGDDQLVQQPFTHGSLQAEKAARLSQGER